MNAYTERMLNAADRETELIEEQYRDGAITDHERTAALRDLQRRVAEYGEE